MGILFPKTYQYKPYQSTNRVRGKISISYGTLTDFVGNIQPMKQKEIESFDIGRENIGKIKIYTDKEFTISTEGEINTGDKIIYDNNEYEVIYLDHHTGLLLPHRKYIAELRLLDEIEGT